MTPTQSCNLVVHGAAGRMGQRIVACAIAEPEQWNLVAAIDRSGHPRLGDDAGQVAGAGDIGVPLRGDTINRHIMANQPPFLESIGFYYAI